MSVVPCEQNPGLRAAVNQYAEELSRLAHTIGTHGLDEQEFYDSGVFRGAIERLRGQFSASMREKREFVSTILNYLQDRNAIAEWSNAGDANRHDYMVELNSGKRCAIELKGCLDGNNTNIFERPAHAQEFVMWSVCTNPAADPRHNVWSGIHTRLSAEIISRSQVVDGLIVWDMMCGTLGRPCPKVAVDPARQTVVGRYQLPPPCLYLFPDTVPSVRNNPSPAVQPLERVEFLQVLHEQFGGRDGEVHQVAIAVDYEGRDTVRTTTVSRGDETVANSGRTAIRRA